MRQSTPEHGGRGTARRSAAAALDFRKLGDFVPAMVVVYNINSGRYVYVNHAITKLLGYEPAAFLKGGLEFVVSLVHPDDLPRIMRKNQAALKKVMSAKPGSADREPIVSFEYRMRHKNGRWVWLQTDGSVFDWAANGQVEHVVNVSIDITDRKRNEEKLRKLTEALQSDVRDHSQKLGRALASLQESEERYQAFVHNSNEGIWRVDVDEPIPVTLPPETQIQLMYERAYMGEANDTMAKMYGAPSREALVGLRLGDLLVREDPHNTEYLLAFIASGYNLSGVESHETDQNGQDKYFRNSLVGIIRDGALVHAWGTQQDVTEQHKAAEALLEKRELEAKATLLAKRHEELVALNQVKDEFISLASHQLRTPLTGVRQYIGMLLEGYAGDLTEKQQFMLERANESSARQLKIIDDLLVVASMDSGRIAIRKQETDLVGLVASIISEHSPLFEKRKQRVTLHAEAVNSMVPIDAGYMYMALENIIDNASKYSTDNSEIVIRVTKARDGLRVHVRDQGVGIATRDMIKLFQKFSRVENIRSTVAGGTGLGLYLAKKIVDLHGGSIDVISHRGGGTTFIVKLPGKIV